MIFCSCSVFYSSILIYLGFDLVFKRKEDSFRAVILMLFCSSLKFSCQHLEVLERSAPSLPSLQAPHLGNARCRAALINFPPSLKNVIISTKKKWRGCPVSSLKKLNIKGSLSVVGEVKTAWGVSSVAGLSRSPLALWEKKKIQKAARRWGRETEDEDGVGGSVGAWREWEYR